MTVNGQSVPDIMTKEVSVVRCGEEGGGAGGMVMVLVRLCGR